MLTMKGSMIVGGSFGRFWGRFGVLASVHVWVVPVLSITALVGCVSSDTRQGNGEGPSPSFPSATGAVLAIQNGESTLNQCTRSVPQRVRGFWLPDSATIDSLEARLAPVLSTALRGAAPRGIEPSTAADFYRQYIGLVHSGGKRTVYVNGFHRQYVAARFHRAERTVSGDTLGWRTEPISVCDGGSRFFGVEYDPRSKQLGRIRFNGRVNR
jgi:hypothetical protein